MKKTTFPLLILLLSALLPPAQSRARKPLGEIDVTIFVNYGSAYRDGTWVPVDVLVKNDDFDIKGSVEVRTMAQGITQSPIYRVPAEIPKGSRKRFRFHCFLKASERIDVMIYDGKSPVMETPSYTGVSPVNAGDILCLVLDEEPMDYSFLFTALLKSGRSSPRMQSDGAFSSDDQSADRIRIHRESLKNESLPFLADHPQCYESFDLIVLGDVEPDRVSERHRRIIQGYVENGGMLVVYTGSNAAKHRGSWIEQWTGTGLGSVESIKESDLALGVFEEGDRQGVRADRDCLLVQLIPPVGAKTFGKEKTLATMRRIGKGCVVVFGIDASSRALQGCDGYLALWSQLYSIRQERTAINLETTGQQCVQAIPFLSGITISGRSGVAGYLFLYVFFGVIANWLFFNYLKRREMAWVTLAIVAFAFCAYAVAFGTSGLSSRNEMENVRILQVPENGNTARQTEFVGTLSSRSARRSFAMSSPFALAKDAGGGNMPWANVRRSDDGRTRNIPFTFVQDAKSSIEGLAIGANDIRILEVQSEVPVQGGIEGKIFRTPDAPDGEWWIALRNNTGLTIKDPRVLLDGVFYKLPFMDGKKPELNCQLTTPIGRGDNDSFNYGYYYNAGTPPEALARFKEAFPFHVFSNDPQQPHLDPLAGPFFCGWLDGPVPSAIVRDPKVKMGVDETLIVVPIPKPSRTGQTTTVLLDVGLGGPESVGAMALRGPNAIPQGYGNWNPGAMQPRCSGSLHARGIGIRLNIDVPKWMDRQETRDIEIRIRVRPENADVWLLFPTPQQDKPDAPQWEVATPAGLRIVQDSPRAESQDRQRELVFLAKDWKRETLFSGQYLQGMLMRPMAPDADPAEPWRQRTRAPHANAGASRPTSDSAQDGSVSFEIEARVSFPTPDEPMQGDLRGWR